MEIWSHSKYTTNTPNFNHHHHNLHYILFVFPFRSLSLSWVCYSRLLIPLPVSIVYINLIASKFNVVDQLFACIVCCSFSAFLLLNKQKYPWSECAGVWRVYAVFPISYTNKQKYIYKIAATRKIWNDIFIKCLSLFQKRKC